MRKHAQNLCQPPHPKAEGKQSFLSAKSIVRNAAFPRAPGSKTILATLVDSLKEETTKRRARTATYAGSHRRLPETDPHQHPTEAVD